MAEPDIIVRDNPGEHRYEIVVDGEVAGFIVYRRDDPGVVVAVHTEIAPTHEGQGLASRLAREMLDDVRRRGEKVVPRCPFVKGWIERHTAYNDLVAPGA